MFFYLIILSKVTPTARWTLHNGECMHSPHIVPSNWNCAKTFYLQSQAQAMCTTVLYCQQSPPGGKNFTAKLILGEIRQKSTCFLTRLFGVSDPLISPTPTPNPVARKGYLSSHPGIEFGYSPAHIVLQDVIHFPLPQAARQRNFGENESERPLCARG